MKVFILGGVTVAKGVPQFEEEAKLLGSSMSALAAELVSQRYEVVLCSPFPDSADFHVFQGIATASKTSLLALIKY